VQPEAQPGNAAPVVVNGLRVTVVGTAGISVTGSAKQNRGVLSASYPQLTCVPPQDESPFSLPSAAFRHAHPAGHAAVSGVVVVTVTVTGGFVTEGVVVVTNGFAVMISCGTVVVVPGLP
jgi:hypothetical protein